MIVRNVTTVLFLSVLSMASCVWSAPSVEVVRLVDEMRASGASVCGGVSKEEGVFFVAIGRANYRADAVNSCQELARVKAVRELASALSTAVKSRSVAMSTELQSDDRVHAESYFSSMTESSVEQALKGVQDVSMGKGSDGRMEAVVYVAEKRIDQSGKLIEAQNEFGDKGVVRAVGQATDRKIAELNALRSAVEQVAGTLVIGKVSVNERDEMHKRLATTAGALVEEYRIVHESRVEAQFRIEVVARVDKRKLYENYRSYFKSLDNPVFCIVATDKALVRNFTNFFIDKGFDLTENPAACDYLIKLDGLFQDRPTPGNDKSYGTQLSLNISVASVDGSRILLSMNERQSKDSEVLTSEQRREEVSRRIFNKLEERLHQAIQDMVVRMLDGAGAPSGQSRSDEADF